MSSTLTRAEFAEFVAAQETRDAALRKEVREEIDKVNTRIDELSDKVDTHTPQWYTAERDRLHQEFVNVNTRIDNVNTRIDDLFNLAERSDAISYNGRVRPHMRLRPIPIYSQQKLVLPNDYPKTARAFFRLRQPQTNDDKKLLISLVQFYDIQGYQRWPVDSDIGSDDDDSDQSNNLDERLSLKEATTRYPRRAVEALSVIWGLDEAGFDDFEARAADLPPMAAKRPAAWETPGDVKRLDNKPEQLKSGPTLSELICDDDSQSTSKKSSEARSGVFWDPSQVPSGGPTLHNLGVNRPGQSGGPTLHVNQPSQSSDGQVGADSPTNPNSSTRYSNLTRRHRSPQ